MFDLSYSFLMPPTILIVICLVAALYALARPRSGVPVVLAASLLLYVSATPVLASFLLWQVESGIPAPPYRSNPQAIVVLGGDVRPGAEPGQPDTLGRLTLERIVYAARLYRIVKLPVAVSGGRVDGARRTLGGLMRDALDEDFAIPVTWTENRSRTTFENALFTARLLQPAGITSVFLVTHAWHMPRAIWSFERVGLRVVPWPTPSGRPHWRHIEDYLPDPGAFLGTFRALHEIIGLAYYRLRD